MSFLLLCIFFAVFERILLDTLAKRLGSCVGVCAFISSFCALGLNLIIEGCRASLTLSPSHSQMPAREELMAQVVAQVCL